MEKVIAISTDQNYLVPVETLIKSIAYNNRDVKIYVINEDISQEWFINLNRRLAPLGITVNDAKLDPAVIQDEQISVDYLSKMAYGRILIPEMILKIVSFIWMPMLLLTEASMIYLILICRATQLVRFRITLGTILIPE